MNCLKKVLYFFSWVFLMGGIGFAAAADEQLGSYSIRHIRFSNLSSSGEAIQDGFANTLSLFMTQDLRSSLNIPFGGACVLDSAIQVVSSNDETKRMVTVNGFTPFVGALGKFPYFTQVLSELSNPDILKRSGVALGCASNSFFVLVASLDLGSPSWIQLSFKLEPEPRGAAR